MRAPASDGPIFIIGNPRSGTTLLRLMLTCHPRIAIPPEAGFLIDLAARHRAFTGRDGEREAFLSDLVVSPKFEHWRLTREDVQACLARTPAASYPALVAAVYACWARAHMGGKPRWGDKNNFYLAHIETLAAFFPEAVFLHITRDGRDVACSYRSLADVKGKYAPQLPSRVFDAVYEWNRSLGRIRRAFARVGWQRVCELRYEDLVADPEGTLRRTCAFLGEDFAPEMLAYDEANRKRELEPREFDAWKRRNRDGIDASAIGRWRTELSADEAALAGLAGGGMLRRYGYETARAAGPRALWMYAVGVARYRARRLARRVRNRATRAASSSA